MRTTAKYIAETLLTGIGIEHAALRVLRRRTLVLAYHNVIPGGERPCGDRSLHLPQGALAAQLDALLATHDVIPLAAIHDAPSGARPRVVLTFDDAYRGAVSVGTAEVVKRGLSATVFVAPGLFGTTTWWDRLADPATGAVLPSLRGASLSAHQGRGERVLKALGPGSGSLLPAWAEIATAEEVRAAAALPGITLGSHTWNHPNLAALDAHDLAAELARPLAWLLELGGRVLPWLAYPYGLTSPAVAQAAARAGYLGAFRIAGGWMPKVPPATAMRYDLPRMNVPSGVSLNGFRLRVAGLLAH
jgi:peptidoglycan/xylan/chitin deacetylase (PgdA/CDA1 family)